ncbi:hypothetical protein JT358_16190 [Micrococcales bacterium 31B]|nr:hypothetical protein [Micrococcales bacterium 31B]
MRRNSIRARRTSLAALLGLMLTALPALASPAYADPGLPEPAPIAAGDPPASTAGVTAPVGVNVDATDEITVLSADELAVQASTAAQAADAETLTQLPDSLKTAIERDLDMTPQDWVTATRLASEGSNLVAAVREKYADAYADASFDPATGRTTIAVTTTAAEDYAQGLGLAVKLVPWSADQLSVIAKEFFQGLTAQQQDTIVSMTPEADNQTVAVRVKLPAGASLADYPTGDHPVTLSVAAPNEQPSVKEAALGATGQPLPDGTGIFLNSTCSLGFGASNAQGQNFWLTAGHCAQDGMAATMNTFINTTVGPKIGDLKWYQFGSKNMNSSNWPGTAPNADISAYSVVPDSGFMPTPQVNTYGAGGVTVDGVVNPTVGMPVCRSGLTTGWQCGQIKATDQQPLVTLDVLPDSRPVDAFDMTMCSLPGDSGGPVMAGNLAVGTLSAVTNLPSPTDPTKCDTSSTNGGQGQHTFGVSINTSLAGTGLVLLQNVKAPTIKSLAAGDKVTLGALPVSGTGTPGDTINLTLNSRPLGTAVVNAKGVWTLSGATVTSVGEFTLTAQAKRDAVNLSAPVNVTFAASTAVATITSPRPGSALLPQAQAITGQATPGASVAVSINGSLAATVIADAKGAWVVPAAPFSLGSATVTVVPTLDGSAGVATTAAYQVNPVQVRFQTSSDAVYTGAQSITGTATPGASVRLTLNGTPATTVTADTRGAWKASLNLPAGTAVLRADATVQSLTASAELKLAVTRLAAPVISAPGTGSNITAGRHTISGTAPAGSNVTVTLNGTTLGSVTATQNGAWSLPNVMFNAGGVTLTAFSAIQQGNVVSGVARAQVQVAAPAPAVSQSAAAQTMQPKDIVINPPAATETKVVPGVYRVSGTAPVGSKVTVILNDEVVGVANVVSATPDAKTAAWSLDVTLVPGANVVTAQAAMGDQQIATELVLSALANDASPEGAPTGNATPTSGASPVAQQAADSASDAPLSGTFWFSLLGGLALLAAAAVMLVKFRQGGADSGS